MKHRGGQGLEGKPMKSIAIKKAICREATESAADYVSSLAQSVAYARVLRKWVDRLGEIELDEKQSLQFTRELDATAEALYEKWSAPMVGNREDPYISIADMFATVRRAIDETEAEARAEEEQGRCM